MNNLQINHVSKQPYTNYNQEYLRTVSENSFSGSNEWVTFLQAKDQGLKIKKGSKGVRIVRVFITGDTNQAGKDKKAIKGYTVFNIQQTEKAIIE